MTAKALSFCYGLDSTHGLPFICMIEGTLKGMCFLIDSGSTECITFKSCVEQYNDRFIEKADKGTIWGVGGVTYKTRYVDADTVFCGKENRIPFQVIDDAPSDRLYEETGIRMHGILGTNFMKANNMMIDFVNERVLVLD